MLTPDVILAFLAGASSIVGGAWTVRRARKEEKEHCEQRISDIRESFSRGLEKGLHLDERDS